MSSNLYLCLCLSACIAVILGYGNGNLPSGVFDTMLPGHYGTSPQTSAAPYEVTLSKSTYSPNEEITVTLKQTGSSMFKGFFIQPRNSVDTFTTHGTIASLPGNAQNPCSGQAAEKNTCVSHNSNSEKSTISFTWTAPSTNKGDIIFVFTVVEKFDTYWVKEQSSPLTYVDPPTQETTSAGTQQSTVEQSTVTQTTGQTSTAPPSSESTITSQQSTAQQLSEPTTTAQQSTAPQSSVPTTTTQQSTAPLPSTITRDPGCGSTLGCFSDEPTCTTDCNSLVSWKPHENDDIEFTMKIKTTSPNYYIAIGFSTDPKMGGDSALQCVSKNHQVTVQSSYNVDGPADSNTVLDNSVYGLTEVATSSANGILSCTVRRKLTSALANGMTGRRKRNTDAERFFDLNNDWFLFVAHGVALSGSIRKHSTPPQVSPAKVDFQSLTDVGNAPVGPTNGVINKNSECGKTKGCYSDCSGDSCSFQLEWEDQTNVVEMTLSCKQSGSSYCAIGLSSDSDMGDDSVFACTSDGTTADVFSSYNTKGSKSNDNLDDPKFGLTFVSGTHVDGVLSCVFSRFKTVDLAKGSGTGRRKRAAADASTFFDMNSDWNLMFATGSATAGSLSKHTTAPVISSQKADFQSNMDLSATNVKKVLVQVHGILMIVAWMFLAPIGIFMARFYKNVWPEGMEWCGIKRWFVVHRAVMILTLLCTAAAFVVIFIEVGGFSKAGNENFEKTHPIIGIVVMALTLINPIMAIFRPAPDASKRIIFNLAHLIVGAGAETLGVINLFSGTLLASSMVPSSSRIVLWVFVGWVILAGVMSHIYTCIGDKKGESEIGRRRCRISNLCNCCYYGKQNKYELDNFSSPKEASGGKSEEVSTFRQVMLGLHIVVVLGLSVAVSVLIGLGHDHDDH